MIVRMWHGRTPAAKAAAYLVFLKERALPDYRRIPGNRSAAILHRLEGDVAHFITLTRWDSMDAIAAFAGEEVSRAKYYPEDAGFLLEFEPCVQHFEESV